MNKKKWFKKTGYRPHKGQKAMHNSKARFRLVVAPRQWGKTLAGTKEAEVMLLEPNTHGWVVANTYDMVENIMREIRKDIGLPPTRSTSYPMNYLEYPWGSAVEGKIAQHPETMLGQVELDWVVFDECAMCTEKVWRIIQMALDRRIMVDQSWWKRLLRKILPFWFKKPVPKPPGKAVLTTTPRGTDWVYERWHEGIDPKNADWWAGTGVIEDNPSIPDDYVEKMRETMSDKMFQNEVEGRFMTKKRT